MKKTYIVVGVSAAGIGALSKLRALDSDSNIICIAKQSELPFNTCLLADFLAGRKEESSIFTRGLDFFEKNNIKLLLNSEVTKIDPKKHEIEINSDSIHVYTKLFLGIGTSLWTPSIKGLNDYKGIFGFQTLEHTYKILDFIKRNNVKKATIIGAGLSGVECSDSLAAQGILVNLVEKQSRILPLSIDNEGSRVIEKLMPDSGVTFYPNSSVSEINGKNGYVSEVVLSSGEILGSEIVIFATGNRPNTKLAIQAGIDATEAGIRVNEFMQTSEPDIFAGGDVALLKNIIDGNLVRSSSWPDAMQQGMHAAFAMSGNPKPYPGVCIIVSSNFYDTTFVSCGNVINPSPDCEIMIREKNDFYHKFILQNGQLVGFLMVGNVQNLGELRKMVISKEPMDKNRLEF